MILQVRCNMFCILTVSFHSQFECPQTSQCQKAIKWTGHPSCCILEKSNCSYSILFVTTQPPITSLCPPIYLVVECTTMPVFNQWALNIGVANVESTTTIIPLDFACFLILYVMYRQQRIVGVSSHSNFVFS